MKRGLRLKRLFSAVLVPLCAVIFWGCSKKNQVEIQPLIEYYLNYIVPNSFTYTATPSVNTGVVQGQPVKMRTDDHSFLMFDRDYKNMSITFDTGVVGEFQKVNLMITSYESKNGQIKGEASRIETDGVDKGTLLRYSFWSDDKNIYLKTLVTYRVFTATDSHEAVMVSRNTIVAKFARTTPSYIGGGIA